MLNNDHKTAYAVARALGAPRTNTNTELFKLDGTITQSPEEEIERWDQHFSSVFMGELKPLKELRSPPPRPTASPPSWMLALWPPSMPLPT